MTDNAFEQRAVALRQRAELASKALGIDAMAAEDIAQDVMLKLWAMHAELVEEDALEGLAAVMAKRMAINMMRGQRTTELKAGTHLTLTSPAEILEEKENERWLRERLARLPKTQNIILRMRQVEQRSLKEISLLLGIEETSVSTLLARARKALLEDIRKGKRL